MHHSVAYQPVKTHKAKKKRRRRRKGGHFVQSRVASSGTRVEDDTEREENPGKGVETA